MRNTSWRKVVSSLPSRAMTAPTHYVLRVARAGRGDTVVGLGHPDAFVSATGRRAVLSGRSRVEVSAEEAHAVLAWARSIDGWDEGERAPLVAIPPPGRGWRSDPVGPAEAGLGGPGHIGSDRLKW